MTDCILRFDGWYDNFPDLILSRQKSSLFPSLCLKKKRRKICRGHLDFNEQEKKGMHGTPAPQNLLLGQFYALVNLTWIFPVATFLRLYGDLGSP